MLVEGSNSRLESITRPPGRGGPKDGLSERAPQAASTLWQGNADCYLRSKTLKSVTGGQLDVFTETLADIPAQLVPDLPVGAQLHVRQLGQVRSYRVRGVEARGVGLDPHPVLRCTLDRE